MSEEDELPKSIIVTNVDLSVFDNLDIKVIKMPNSKNLKKKKKLVKLGCHIICFVDLTSFCFLVLFQK